MNAATADPGVTVTGVVSSILPFLAQACILTVPIALGSGTRLKILEAFAQARPVVSTRVGTEGLAVENEQNLLLADSPREFAAQCARLLAARSLRERLVEDASRLVAQAHALPPDW